MPKFLKRAALLLLAVLVLAAAAALALVATATVETTAGGAPARLRLHLPGIGDAAFPIYSATAGKVRIPGFLEGPIVRTAPGGGWTATWFCEDHVQHAGGTEPELQLECAGRHHAYPLRSAPQPAEVAPMPARVAVLSDIEGNLGFLDRALQRLGVTDATGGWAYGDGQLVILGDSVDRGRDVSAVLWRLHGLALQAQASGGTVRVLLGNHEQYLLRTNPSRAHPDQLYALNAMGGYRDAYAAGTLLGDWLRRQPVLLQLGRVLFVHGGVSPQVAASGLSVAQLNAAMRDYWRAPGAGTHSPALDAVLGPAGLTQYRGWFRASEGRYPAASEAEVAQALARFGADMAVVGHTQVDKVTALHGGRVYAVDVNSNEAAPEVLVFEDGRPRVIDIGVGRQLPDRQRRFRDFRLLDAADRRLLLDACRELRRLSALPHPY